MNLDDLRAEHARERIGPLWLAAVKTVCQGVVRQYPPTIYSAAPTWRDGLEDLVQEVVTNALLRDAQVEYILDVALTTEDVRRLLRRQVRHVLSRGRRRTVVDQLLARSVRLLEREPFAVVDEGPPRAWSLDGDSQSRQNFREAVGIVRSAARVPHHGVERAPSIFTTGTLSAILQAIATIHNPLSRHDLARILELGLTPFLPDVLFPRDSPLRGASLLDPEDEVQVSECVASVVDELSEEQIGLLRAKLLGRSDTDVAAELGVSRPTAATRKRVVLEVLEAVLTDLRPELRDAALDRLSVRLLLPQVEDGGGIPGNGEDGYE
jgi:hypothetical protein